MGSPGRRAVSKMLGALRSRLDAHFVIVNGENAAGGLGITKPTAAAIFDAGADVITLGNHTFAKRDVAPYHREEPRIIRPANYPPGVPGQGLGRVRRPTGDEVAVVNLMGRTFMDADRLPVPSGGCGSGARSATSRGSSWWTCTPRRHRRRMAMGWYLDGRVSAVIGTHTHVQTSDERVLPRRHGLYHRCRHDRRARFRAGAGQGRGRSAVHDAVKRQVRARRGRARRCRAS